jgi:hypothetical protein
MMAQVFSGVGRHLCRHRFLEESVRGLPYRGEEVLSTPLLQKGGQVPKVVVEGGLSWVFVALSVSVKVAPRLSPTNLRISRLFWWSKALNSSSSRLSISTSVGSLNL